MATLDALPDDLRDMLVALVDAHVELVVVGGWAMAVHGRVRATEDLLIAALLAFGAPVSQHGVTAQLFQSAGYGYRFGVKPNLVELFDVASGVSFEAAIADAPRVDVEGRSVPVIGRAALLANKRAAGRHKDLDDVAWPEAPMGAGQAVAEAARLARSLPAAIVDGWKPTRFIAGD